MVTMREIAVAVCAEYNITLDELRGPSVNRRLSYPRQDFMWRARQVKFSTGKQRFSLMQIAQYLNRLDHATICHGVRVHQQRMRNIVGNHVCRSAGRATWPVDYAA